MAPLSVAIIEGSTAGGTDQETSEREAAVADLGNRLLAGMVFHPALLAFVELRIPGADGLPRALVIACFACLLIVRLVALRMTRHRRGSLALRMAVIALGGIGLNAMWGLRCAAVLVHSGASEQAMIVVIIVCGLATGGMTAFAPSLWIQRTSQAALLLPAVLLGLAGASPVGLAVLHAVFFAYIVAQGTIAHRTYWQAMHASAALQRHADAALRAAVAAEASNRQLRAEIEQRAKVEIELRHAQKLEAIGRLAAGIAHEINTPVQFVSDSCQFLGDGIEQLTGALDDCRRIVTGIADGRLSAAEALADSLRIDRDRDLLYLRDKLPSAAARALDGLGRVAKIVAATKEFAYPHLKDKAFANLNQAIENTLIISNNETKYVADVQLELGALPPVLCHCGEINQAMLNLIVNAAHAISDVVGDSGARGTIRIRTWADGERAWIAISDTGGGIPADIIDKVFEPFFTTKPVGRGTGQGLAIARSAIVDKHGGTLEVSSQPGAGTTFTIGLPIN